MLKDHGHDLFNDGVIRVGEAWWVSRGILSRFGLKGFRVAIHSFHARAKQYYYWSLGPEYSFLLTKLGMRYSLALF